MDIKNFYIGQIKLPMGQNRINIVEIPKNKRIPVQQQPSSSSKFFNTVETQIVITQLFDDKHLYKNDFTSLQELIQQLDITPFLTIYNENIGNIINTYEGEYKNQVNVQLQSMSIETVPDLPKTLQVNMQFVVVNIGQFYEKQIANYVLYKKNKYGQITNKAYESELLKSKITKTVEEKINTYNFSYYSEPNKFSLYMNIEYQFQKNINRMEQLLSHLRSINPQNIDQNNYKNDIIKKYTQIITDFKNQKDSLAEQIQELKIDVKPTKFKFGFENFIAPIHAGKSFFHSYPIYQYFGTSNKTVQIEYTAQNVEELNDLKKYINFLSSYGKELKELGMKQPIKIINKFTQLIGEEDFYLDIVQYASIDENPGQFIINMQLNSETNEVFDDFVSDQSEEQIDQIFEELYDKFQTSQVNIEDFLKNDFYQLTPLQRTAVLYYPYIHITKSYRTKQFNKLKDLLLGSFDYKIDLYIDVNNDAGYQNDVVDFLQYVLANTNISNKINSINLVPLRFLKKWKLPKFDTIQGLFEAIKNEAEDNNFVQNAIQIYDESIKIVSNIGICIEPIKPLENSILTTLSERKVIKTLAPQIKAFKTFTTILNYISQHSTGINIAIFDTNAFRDRDYLYSSMMNVEDIMSGATAYNSYTVVKSITNLYLQTQLDYDGKGVPIKPYNNVINSLARMVSFDLLDNSLLNNIMQTFSTNLNFFKQQLSKYSTKKIIIYATELKKKPEVYNNNRVINIFNTQPVNQELKKEDISNFKKNSLQIQKEYFVNEQVVDNISNQLYNKIILQKIYAILIGKIKDFVNSEESLTETEFQKQLNQLQKYVYQDTITKNNLEFLIGDKTLTLLTLIALSDYGISIDDKTKAFKIYKSIKGLIKTNQLDSTLLKLNPQYKDVFGYNYAKYKDEPKINDQINNTIKQTNTIKYSLYADLKGLELKNDIYKTLYFNIAFKNDKNKTISQDKYIEEAKQSINFVYSQSDIIQYIKFTMSAILNQQNINNFLTEKSIKIFNDIYNSTNNKFLYDPEEIFATKPSLQNQTTKKYLSLIVSSIHIFEKYFEQLVDTTQTDNNFNILEVINEFMQEINNNIAQESDLSTFDSNAIGIVDQIASQYLNTQTHLTATIASKQQADYSENSKEALAEQTKYTNEELKQLQEKIQKADVGELKGIIQDSMDSFAILEETARNLKLVDQKQQKLLDEFINIIHGLIWQYEHFEYDIKLLQPKQAIVFYNRNIYESTNYNSVYFDVLQKLYYKGVVGFSVTKSKDSPMHVQQIQLSNRNGNLVPNTTAAKEQQIIYSFNGNKLNSVLQKLLINAGTEIQIVVGYKNNIYELPLVFQGVISSATEEDAVNIVAESYGRDLLLPKNQKDITQDQKIYINSADMQANQIQDSGSLYLGALNPNINGNIFTQQNLLSNVVAIQDYSQEDYKKNIYVNIYKPYQFLDLQTKTEKFANAAKVILSLNTNKEISYNPYQPKTGYNSWDIIVDQYRRTYDYIQYLDDFGFGQQRLFFGKKDYLYYTQNYEVTKDEDNFGWIDKYVKTGVGKDKYTAKILQNLFKNQPFSKTHDVMTYTNLISNNIQTNEQNLYNQVSVYGKKGKLDGGGIFGWIFSWFYDTREKTEINNQKYVLSKQFVDDDIPEAYIKMFHYIDENAYSSDLRKVIQARVLEEKISDYYGGSITMIGNPYIKPYDKINLVDVEKEMYGNVGVKRVTFHYNHNLGFVTEVEPYMLVDTQEFSQVHQLKEFFLGLIPTALKIGTIYLGTMAVLAQAPQATMFVVAQAGFQSFSVNRIQNFLPSNLILNTNYVAETNTETYQTYNEVYSTQILKPIFYQEKLMQPKFVEYKSNKNINALSKVKKEFKDTIETFTLGLQDFLTEHKINTKYESDISDPINIFNIIN